jgi:hypothetical protein
MATMSWDIAVMDLPLGAATVSDIAADFEPELLGDRTALISKILEVAPTTDFSDPTWGELNTPQFTIEFNMGQSDHVSGFMLHVRGGDLVIAFIADLLAHLGLRAIDCSNGEFFEPAASAEGLTAWRAFRDQAADGWHAE